MKSFLKALMEEQKFLPSPNLSYRTMSKGKSSPLRLNAHHNVRRIAYGRQ